ncbi:protein CutA homolog isoform X2 [Narcine bancroftii]|uniref:protein CutA homolog isoform X2 n=1 Tax=Narcine bancroftii TaxID=1343680 RepID=UPI00383231BC
MLWGMRVFSSALCSLMLALKHSPLKATVFVLVLTLLMLSRLRSVGLRLFSMETTSYVSSTHSVAFVTCPNMDVAKQIARNAVEKNLAACVNIVPQITSVYKWKGNIEEDSEVLLMIKTRTTKVDDLSSYVRLVHPYEVAEVISLPIDQGNPPYMKWLSEAVPE